LKTYKPIYLFLAFTLLLALPPLLLQYFAKGYLLVPGFWLIFLLMSAVTLIVIGFVLTVQKKHNEWFAQSFLGATTFKLLICLIFFFIFISKTHPQKTYFVVDFMYLYFLNTAFEIYGLLRNLRNQNLR